MTVLAARDVIAGYRPDLPILHGVSVTADTGEVVTIIGPNGAGKSTLIKAIAGLVPVSSGAITLDGRTITGLAAHRLAAEGVAYVPQTGNVFTGLTIAENLVVGGIPLPRAEAAARAEAMLALFPILAEKRRAKAGSLSGGQRQLLAMARALLTDPRLILLDEPTAGLAPKAAAELFLEVRRLAERGTAVLMVEQNAKAALRMSDRAYVLAEGENRIDGPAASLLADPKIGAIFLGFRPEEAH